jgi:3-oxoacyl-[acyl-carrier-protein] synthase III
MADASELFWKEIATNKDVDWLVLIKQTRIIDATASRMNLEESKVMNIEKVW